MYLTSGMSLENYEFIHRKINKFKWFQARYLVHNLEEALLQPRLWRW